MRGLQANQALGNILQQSTDADGNVDYQDAQQGGSGQASRADGDAELPDEQRPVARGADPVRQAELHGLLARMSSTIARNDPSDGNLDKIDATAAALELTDSGARGRR